MSKKTSIHEYKLDIVHSPAMIGNMEQFRGNMVSIFVIGSIDKNGDPIIFIKMSGLWKSRAIILRNGISSQEQHQIQIHFGNNAYLVDIDILPINAASSDLLMNMISDLIKNRDSLNEGVYLDENGFVRLIPTRYAVRAYHEDYARLHEQKKNSIKPKYSCTPKMVKKLFGSIHSPGVDDSRDNSVRITEKERVRIRPSILITGPIKLESFSESMDDIKGLIQSINVACSVMATELSFMVSIDETYVSTDENRYSQTITFDTADLGQGIMKTLMDYCADCDEIANGSGVVRTQLVDIMNQYIQASRRLKINRSYRNGLTYSEYPF